MSDKNISTRAIEPIYNLTTIKTRIVNKHDTEANWNASGVKDRFVPKQGEMVVYDIDSTHTSERIKIGDGTTAVGSLPFIGDVTAAGSNDFTGYNSFSKHVNLKYGPEGYIDFGNGLQFWGNYVTKITDNTQSYNLTFPINKTGRHTFAMLDDLPVANPTEAGTATLTKLKVGDTVYSLPSGGGSGDVTAAGNNTFTGNNTFDKPLTIKPLETSGTYHATKIEDSQITLAFYPSSTASEAVSSITLKDGAGYPQIDIKSDSVIGTTGLSVSELTIGAHASNYRLQASDSSLKLIAKYKPDDAETAITKTLIFPVNTAGTDTIALTSDIDVTAAGDNTFTGTNSFEQSIKIGRSDLANTLYDTDRITITQGAEKTILKLPVISEEGGAAAERAVTLATTNDLPVANPTEAGTATLTKLKVGDTVYSLPSGGGSGDVTAAGDNTFTGINTFSKHVALTFGPEGYVDFGNGLRFWGNHVTKIIDNTQSYNLTFPTNKTGLHTFAMLDDLPVANPTAEGTTTLTKLKIGDVIYAIPSGGGSGDVTAAGDNTFTGINKFSFTDSSSIENYIKLDQTHPNIRIYQGAATTSGAQGLTIYPGYITLHSNNKLKQYGFPNKSGTLALTGDIPKLLAHFPIGYIYISTSSTSPANLFGGTWEQIKDKFLLAAGDTYTAGNIGGNANAVLVRHGGHVEPSGSTGYNTSQYETAPDSANSYYMSIDKTSKYGDRRRFTCEFGNEVGIRTLYNASTTDGKGKNMPPYLTVYMWKRIS